MATRPAKATGTSRPRRPQPPGKPVPGKPASGKAASGKPASGKPASGKPASGQPAASGQATAPGRPAASGQPSSPGPAAAAPRERPRALLLAAALLAVEAAGMCVAAGFAAAATANGQSYQKASGVALTLIAVGVAAVFALFAVGLAKARPWTRTPVVMAQLAIGVWGIYLLKDRLDWGVPMLLVAACVLVALFTPASLRALNRPPRQP
jgi:hypothetical protein